MSYKYNPLTGNLDLVSGDEPDSISDEFTADQNISALRAVRLTSGDTIALADNSTCETSLSFGVSTSGANTGEKVSVINQGILKDAFFNFPLDDILFLGSSGEITNIPPSTGFSLVIGKSLGPGAIYIDIDLPIQL